MVVKKGTITLVTGGTMQGEHPNGTAPGETLGTSIQGGKETLLHAGDIVHIPAGIPHQAKIAPGTTVTYLVFKEKEK
jgi:mannose-6-phosphate isomerase-like protein (cupin superfamily)